MFTWICPQCGREVPPSYTDCPDCSKKAAEQPVVAAAQAPPPAPPPQAPPPQAPPQYIPAQAAPQYAPPQQPAYAPPPPPPYSQGPAQPAPNLYGRPYEQAATAPRRPLPTWLLTVVFAFAFLGLGAGIYWLVGAMKGSGSKPSAAVESPAAKPGAKVNALQKYIEIGGVRFIENKKKTEVRFVVVNHSPAEISGLAGNVTIWGRTQKSEEDAAGTFTFSTSLGPWESKEMTAPLNTKLKIYELPDWQNVSTDLQITAPAV